MTGALPARLLCCLTMLVTGQALLAHPLGNNTVNRLTVLELGAGAIAVDYLVDMAEIPTLLAAHRADSDSDGSASADEWRSFSAHHAAEVRARLRLSADGERLPLTVTHADWSLSRGDAGLATLRLQIRLTAPFASRPGAPIAILYSDGQGTDEQGWKEVVARAAAGIRLDEADVPGVSASHGLQRFAPTPAGGVPRVSTARLRVTVAEAPATRAAQAPEPVAGITADTWAPPADGPSRAAAFFRLGAQHIGGGADHMVFLLGLLAARRSMTRLAWVVTAFTAAHSLTLALAAAGLVRVPAAWIEPAIALTIAYVGLGNLLGRQGHGTALAFAFGLVHGFGFAAALSPQLAPADRGSGWLLDLAAFNLGIEAVQLLLILALLPLLHRLWRSTWSGAVHGTASVAVLAAGLGWFLLSV